MEGIDLDYAFNSKKSFSVTDFPRFGQAYSYPSLFLGIKSF